MWKQISQWVFWFALIFYGIGCSSSLEQRADKSERDINSLKRAAKKIRDDAVSSKKELADQVAKCDEIIGKTNALLGLTPEVVVPPRPVTPINPIPDPHLPVVPVNPVTPINPLPQPIVPTPQPKPDGPDDGRFGIARAVWSMAQKIGSPDLKTECRVLASNFEIVASKVASGSLNSELPFGQEPDPKVVQILRPQWAVISEALSELNAPVIEKNSAAWDVPSKTLGKTISTFYKEKKLKTNKDWSDLFNEIAMGLRAVT